MVIGLNLVKPMSSYQMAIAKKCGWKNIDSVYQKKNIIPEGFVGNAKLEQNIYTISTGLNKNNFTIMEYILGNDKLERSPFVRANLSEILNEVNTKEGLDSMHKLLTPENVDKLDYIRNLMKKHPNDYIKDKSIVKYVTSPAGINSVFKNLDMLKASYVLDKDALNLLFKKDVTQGEGLKILSSIGRRSIEELSEVKSIMNNDKNTNSLPAEVQLSYFS